MSKKGGQMRRSWELVFSAFSGRDFRLIIFSPFHVWTPLLAARCFLINIHRSPLAIHRHPLTRLYMLKSGM
jgi:hypothetical protein